jgi:hypothetical protein
MFISLLGHLKQGKWHFPWSPALEGKYKITKTVSWHKPRRTTSKKRGGGRYLTGKIRHRALAAVSAVADAVDGRPLR